jgi:tetratricopeptide (TPR) repeat protein
MLILLVCAGIAYRAFKHNPRLFFFISVYVFSLLPVIQIIPLLTLKNDRYLYFPMIGVVGIAALLLSSLQVRPGRFQGAVMVTAVAICLFFGGVTYSQAQKWSDTRTLWQFAIRQDPNNMLAWLMLTKAYTEMGKTQEAMSALKTYLELKSKFGPLRGWEGIGA